MGLVAVATLLRLAVDPIIGNQIPYFVYAGAVVVATWYAGADGGVLSVLLGTISANYFFVPPRYELIPSGRDLAAMSLQCAVALGLVWFVGRSRRTETALQSAHAQIRAILEQMPVGVMVSNAEGKLLFGNSAVERILRRSFTAGTLDQFRNRSAYTAQTADGRAVSTDQAALSRALRGEVVSAEENRLLWPDGSRSVVTAYAAPIKDDRGHIRGGVLALVDVTEEKRIAEDARRQAEELQAILDTVPAVVLISRDAEGLLVDGNRFAYELMRMPPGSNLSKGVPGPQQPPFRAMRDGKDVPPAELPVRAAVAHKHEIRNYEFDIVHPDGTTRTLFGNATPLHAPDGTIRGALGAFLDISDRKRLETELRLRMEELSAATLAAEVGVWMWLPEAHHVSVGANWRGLFGVPPDAEVTFETWANAVHPDDRERAIETLASAWKQQGKFSVEYRVVCPDGTVRWLIDRGRPTYDKQGRALGMSGINVDITERKYAEEALRDANRLKDEFLATLSHELRTPLNAIVGWSDMLRRGHLKAADQQKASDSIYRNAKIQSELINDVLDVSRIISGKVRIESRPVEPAALLQAAVEAVRTAADAKGVVIATDFAPVPFALAGDPTRLQQVFWNLLSNAVKFTPAGGRVRASLTLVDGNIQVEVSDTGIGIPHDFLPFVFERFRQRDSSSTRKHGGLGLGLAIVKHLVELHGGTVRAESAGEGKGATFTMRLPAIPFSERRREERAVVRHVRPIQSIPDDLPSLCGLRVLIVDDERDAREVTASVLRHHGASVAVAASGAQALEQFALFDPNVMLVDLAMPVMDGYGLMERIRRESGEKGRRVGAIAFTAYARDEDQRRALSRGFQMHLAKPVDSHSLVRAVARVHRPGPTGT